MLGENGGHKKLLNKGFKECCCILCFNIRTTSSHLVETFIPVTFSVKCFVLARGKSALSNVLGNAEVVVSTRFICADTPTL